MTVQEFRQRVTIIIGTVVALVSWLSSFAMFWYAVVVQEIAVGRVVVLFIFIAAMSTAIVRGKDA